MTYQEWLDYFADLVENEEVQCHLCVVLDTAVGTHHERRVQFKLIEECGSWVEDDEIEEYRQRLLESIDEVERQGGRSFIGVLRYSWEYVGLVRDNSSRAAWLRDGAPGHIQLRGADGNVYAMAKNPVFMSKKDEGSTHGSNNGL